MNVKSPPSPAPALTMLDIYYVLFRHKWKILFMSFAGLVAVFSLPFVWPRPYKSEAKLFIRYVMETKSPGQIGNGDSRMKSPDERGENIINSELEILTSLDLSQQVADAIGPEKILAVLGGGSNRNKAAAVINQNLVAEAPRKSNVLRIDFQHPDPKIVQAVLREVVEAYLKRHAEVHRAVGVFDDFLTQETDQLRSRLVLTENALRAARTNAGITSLEDARRTTAEQISRIRQELFNAEAESAERQAVVSEMRALTHAQPVVTSKDQAVARQPPVPSARVAEYRRYSNQLDVLVRREQDLLLQFTAENSMVKTTQEQINLAEKRKNQLEEEYPGLLAVAVSEERRGELSPGLQPDLNLEMARVSAISSKINVLNKQLLKLRGEADALDAMEGSITELQRKKELEEAHYKYFSANLEQARIDETLGAGRVSNISRIQAPSPPVRDSMKMFKAMAIILFGSIAGSVALAFVIEFYVDRSLRRPQDIEAYLRQTFVLCIPRVSAKGQASLPATRSKLLPLLTQAPELATISGGQPGAVHRSNLDLEPVSAAPNSVKNGLRQTLRPFYDTLRDRLIAYFEAKNLPHKPKLVAVTSCAEGAGVTATAIGLAASLSETGDGNVLLVDMNLEHGEAHHFYKGRLMCGLDDVLEDPSRREAAFVRENLYVVSAATNSDSPPRTLPKRFKDLLPRLLASDYEYIIFDMPPTNQNSVTPRIARFMDMLLLVVESEKTDRDVVKQATTLLSESKANIGVILNKSKAYLPTRLKPEF